MKRGNKNTLHPRDRILITSSNLFAKKGYSETNVETIAKNANVNKAIVYYYFKDKASLLFEIISTYTDRNVAMAEQIVLSDSPPIDKLRRLVIGHVKFQLADLALGSMATLELKSLPPTLGKKAIISRDRYEAYFHESIAEGIKSGDLIKVDSKLYTHFILGFLNSINIWYKKRKGLSPDQIAEKAWEAIYRSLKT